MGWICWLQHWVTIAATVPHIVLGPGRSSVAASDYHVMNTARNMDWGESCQPVAEMKMIESV